LSYFSIGAENGLTRRYVSSFQEKHYEFVVMQSDLDDAPVWHETETNPPFSLRAAITSASAVAKKIPNSEDWKVSSITLEKNGNRAGQWIYVVVFTTFYKDTILVGPLNTFKIPVLLNGKTPELKMR
jgi:hypothetical protein